MKTLLLPLILATLYIGNAVAQEDEYDYQETPTPKQIADLVDDDRDGVINARDLCPDTPLSSDIDNDGCGTYITTQETMALHILFANDSADINPAFLGQIRSMSDFLKQYPSTSIEIQGFASRVGKAEYNLKLSKRRAFNVENALISNGISSSRIKIVGYGDTKLTDEFPDEIAHAKNRKVVATVIGYKGSIKEEWTIFTKIKK